MASTMIRPRLLAYAQLLRLPNVFTAFADIGLGACAAGYLADRPEVFALLLLASGCLYLGGMVWNDVFDRHDDAKTQAFRPIPSGRVSVRVAVVLGSGLMLAGLGFALVASDFHFYPDMVSAPPDMAGWVGTAVMLYDGWLKRTPAGPLGMGLCRFLNVLLGLSAAGPPTAVGVHLAAVVGVYIVGVTWFARTEDAESNRRQLVLAVGVMALSLGLALLVPTYLPPGSSPWYFPWLVVGFGFLVGGPVAAAVRRPDPKRVQAAVKRCVLGLVVLDAVLATAFVGGPGLLIVLLLPPALLLGKWVYST